MNAQLRVVKDNPCDPHYSDADRRVWYRDSEVSNWVVADEFRRVVILADGKVLSGDVRVERVAADYPGKALPVAAEPSQPCNTGFVGVFVHEPAPVAPPAEPSTPAIVIPPASKRRGRR